MAGRTAYTGVRVPGAHDKQHTTAREKDQTQ